ncbi:MAG: general secretion pathway protein GspK [Synergistaceae bacterium]|nr:general secretion pathway protein GspK [Synergistaceae bacterium]
MMKLKALSFSHKRRGFVLVSVLMLGVLLISCATAFSWFVRQQVRTVGNELHAISSRSMARVLVNSIIGVLATLDEHVGYDSPTQKWYQPLAVPLEDLGIWIVRITPLDDKIPIRSLFLPDANTLRRELADPWKDMWEKLNHRELEDLVLDFLDRNNKARVGSVENEYFLNRAPFDISELLMMSQDITPELLYGSGNMRGIADYCTIYSDGRINLNVAPVHVMELLPGLDTGGLAERIARERLETPLQSLDGLSKLPGAGPKTATQLTNIAAFKSRYFQVDIDCLNAETEGGTSFQIVIDRTTKQIVRWEEF